MEKNNAIELFLGTVDIKGVGERIREFANIKLHDFLGGDKSYIENCNICMGMIADQGNRAFPAADGKGYVLLPDMNSEMQRTEAIKGGIQEFETVMLETIKKQTQDNAEGHHITEHVLYNGSGQSRFALEDDYILFPHFVSWCVYSSAGNNHSQINVLVRKVILLFLKKCFLDPDEIKSLSKMDMQEAAEWLDERSKEIEFNFTDTYVQTVRETYYIDIDSCNKISMEPYEKRVCKGRILFVPANVEPEKEWKTIVAFEDNKKSSGVRKMSDIQGTRKFLEICQESYLLVCEGEDQLIGFLLEENVDSEYTVIQFSEIASWELKVKGETVLCYERGDYFATRRNYEVCLAETIREYSEIECVDKIIEALKEIKHGALIIIGKDAETEADRLAKVNRATKVEAFSLDEAYSEKMIRGMANVDGAILIDYKGKCRAFGVILDGEARVKGLEKRGARYNSAMNYIGKRERIAIIVSEDKSKGIVIIRGEDVPLIEKED